MDDFKIWLYVIVGAIYLLSRMKKKSPQQTDSNMGEAQPPANESAPQKALTFEELLREITETKQPATQVNKPEPKMQKRVDYDDELGEEERDLEEVDYDYRTKDAVYNVYEEAKKQAFVKPSLEETLKLEDTVIKFGKFKAFDIEGGNTLVDQYKSELQDPEGFKKALVMSEILNRRF